MIADAGHDINDAAQYYNAVSNGQPNLRLAQILASWQARQGAQGLAQQELVSLVQAHPDLQIAMPGLQAQIAQPAVATATQGLAEAYLTLAGSLNQSSATFLREVFLRFALQLRPDLSAARLLLANTLSGGDNPAATPSPIMLQNALDALEPVTPQDPLFAPVAMQEANLLASLGRPADAVAMLDKLIAMNPQDPGLLATAGDTLRAANEMQAAIPYYSKAIAAVGDPPPPAAWSLFFDRGICEDTVTGWAAADPDMLQA
jgi:tetratricopeptide (TPR) repeat protein